MSTASEITLFNRTFVISLAARIVVPIMAFLLMGLFGLFTCTRHKVAYDKVKRPIDNTEIEIVKKEFPTATCEFVVLGQSNGANVGPGLCAAYYFGDERISANCVKEKVILESILSEK